MRFHVTCKRLDVQFAKICFEQHIDFATYE